MFGPLKKVISGGQTGADIAGVRIAKAMGLETGGTMPLGFRTLRGSNPTLGALYGFTESPSASYPPRTEANVRDSDGTMRFARHWGTPGEWLTSREIIAASKPSFVVNVGDPLPPKEAADWILRKSIRTLNVAGNSEETCPGIEEFVCGYLREVFELLQAADTREFGTEATP